MSEIKLLGIITPGIADKSGFLSTRAAVEVQYLAATVQRFLPKEISDSNSLILSSHERSAGQTARIMSSMLGLNVLSQAILGDLAGVPRRENENPSRELTPKEIATALKQGIDYRLIIMVLNNIDIARELPPQLIDKVEDRLPYLGRPSANFFDQDGKRHKLA